jgi:hypothetical protein
MIATNLTTQTPAEIDAELADLYQEKATATRNLDWAITAAHRITNDNKRNESRGRGRIVQVWATSDHDTIALVRAAANGENARNIQIGKRPSDVVTQLDTANTKLDEIIDGITVRNDEWHRRGRWSRFFIVQQNNGHIHSSMSCSTCNNGAEPTDFGWMPELSGKSEAEAIAYFKAHAMILCSVCFPNAPVEMTTPAPKLTAAEKAAAKAAAEAKAQIEDPDLIADVDGSELRGHHRYEIIKKVRSAEIAYVGAMVDARWYPNSASEYTQTADRILAALAHKAGKTTEELAAGFADRINKKYARDVRDADKHAKRLGL